jgi:formiminoglutamase
MSTNNPTDSPFARPPAGDDPQWPRASAWLTGGDPATAPLRVVGVPCSVGSISPSQAWRTPDAVRQALARLSPWDPVAGIDLAEALSCADLGDWPVADLDLQPAIDDITRRAAGLDRDAVHVFLGGDNAITRAWVAGLCGPDLSRVGVVTMDAHHDVRHLDDGPRNGTPIRGLIEGHGLPGTNVVQIGIAPFANSAAYAAWCADQGITIATVQDVRAMGGAALAMREALARLSHCEVIAVDLDVDVLDVAHAPACPGARPGGLTPDDLFAAARVAGADARVVAADLVEVDSTTDHDGCTVMAMAMTLLAFAAGVATR